MATPKSIAFHTLGCKLNFSETSMLAQQFRERGYHIVGDDEPADIYVLNTCSVTEFADRKCRKAVRQALRCNPGARVIVTGCYAQLQPEKIAEIPGVDLVLGAGEKFHMLNYVEALDRSTDRAWVERGTIDEATAFFPAQSYGDRTRTFLKVQDGCDYKCSFCTIPKARGRSRSARIADLLLQAQALETQGIKEIVLTGVNIGDFGVNQAEVPETLFDLISLLDSGTNIPRFRISSIEPNLCDVRIIDFVAVSERFMPHFHMPLQSGCDATLRRMRRRYGNELYSHRVTKIRKVMPHACIGADVIVGFPGETEEEFNESYQFIEELDVSYLHVFTYSERPDTPAAAMGRSVPMKVRRERHDLLQILSEKKRQAFYQKHLGQERAVLLEKSKIPGCLTGFTDNYIKVVVPAAEYTINTVGKFVLSSELYLTDMPAQCTA